MTQILTDAMIEAGARYMSDNGLGIMGNGYLDGLYTAMESARDPDELREALVELEAANDALCGLRSREQYLAMIDSGQQEALERLDQARRNARTALSRNVGDVG